jgi:CRISPR-associated protein Cas1
MYAIRFPDEDLTALTIQQIRGREGARVRSVYRKMSKQTSTPWHGREYNPDDFDASDPVNKALSAAHACLYGIVHSVIVALGCSPGLGFIHSGHERSFVYDIADLYKAEITIPIAFETAAKCDEKDDIGSITRRAVRDAVSDGRILTRAVRDIRYLLLESDDDVDADILELWDDKHGFTKSGVAYGKELDEIDDAEINEGYGDIL